MRTSCCWTLITLLFTLPALAADGLQPALVLDDIDLERCSAICGDEVQAAPTRAALAVALCGVSGNARWATQESKALERHFVVAFKKPIALGTVCAPDYPGSAKIPLRKLTGSFVSVLRAGAEVPDDPRDNAPWQLLRSGAVKYLPAGVKTRALRFSVVYEKYFRLARASSLGHVLCLRERYYGATEIGSISRRRIDTEREVVFGSWLEPLPFAGIFLHGPAAGACTVELLAPASKAPVAHAAEASWGSGAGTQRQSDNVFTFSPASRTRGIRVTAPLVKNRSALLNILPLVALGDRALSPGAHTPPPFTLDYTMPLPGFAAIDIHDKKTGTLVRRLIGETARDQGAIKEPWDLRNNDGQVVPPGEYTWRGLAVPPLKRIFEMTLYNAGTPAWKAPPPQGQGGGGWLADHTPPNCAAAQGELMWLGANVVEDGHCFIATDLEGRKLWGRRSLSGGFRGPSRIAVDERCAYGITNSVIYRVDPQREFTGRAIFSIVSTGAQPWPTNHGDPHATRGGLAARDGKLYVAIDMPDTWLRSALVSANLDPGGSEPSVRLYKNGGRRREGPKIDKVYGFGQYDELMSFYAAFMQDQMPPETLSYANQPLTCNSSAFFGDAPTDGKNRGHLVVAFKEPIAVGSVLIPDGAIKVQALKPGIAPNAAVTSATSVVSRVTTLQGDREGESLDLELDDEALDEETTDGAADDSLWITLKRTGKPGQPTVALAPPGGVKTRAIRYRTQRLPFTQVLARRLTDCGTTAERLFTEGKLTSQGGVSATRRNAAFSAFKPAVMALAWAEEHAIRGLGFKRVETIGTPRNLPPKVAVDRWVGGTDDVKASLHEDDNWETIKTFDVSDSLTFFQADLGGTVRTRALRVRCLGGYRCTKERVHYSGIPGLVVYEPVGDDPKGLAQTPRQRIAVLQLPSPEDDEAMATVSREILLRRPDALAFDADGILHCMADGQIVTVPLQPNQESRVVVARKHFDKPVQFTFGPQGLIYVTDRGPNVVKVFDPQTGQPVRTIGTPGGFKAGPWDPLRLYNPAQVAVDKHGKIWVADQTYTARSSSPTPAQLKSLTEQWR